MSVMERKRKRKRRKVEDGITAAAAAVEAVGRSGCSIK